MEKQLKSRKEAVVFGFSELGIRILSYIRKINPSAAACFCDNSQYKWGVFQEDEIIGGGGGVKICSVEEAVANHPHALYFIASKLHTASMAEQLNRLGVRDADIIRDIPASILEEDEAEKGKIRCTPRDLIHFEVDIAEHCNLKCRSCHHFTPLAEKKFTDLETFKRDMNRMSELFNGVADRIYLLGGEPLLNPRITEYLVTARNAFSQADIEIVTNGVMLLDMETQFWQICSSHHIVVTVTKYPIKLDYDRMAQAASEYGVECRFFGNTVEEKKMSHYPLDLTGSQDEKESFRNCNMANDCITLKDGRIYTCVIPPNIEHFNQYFNQSLAVLPEDSIDIYQVKDAEEILDFLSRPIPFCRYCNVKDRTYDNEWAASRCTIDEWT